MKIYDFDDYKEYVKRRVRQSPNKGQGEFQKMSAAMRVHPSLTSQVFNGDRDLSPDQAWQLSSYLGLLPLESEYFLVLVQLARASQAGLKKFLRSRLEQIRQDAHEKPQASNPDEMTLNDRDRATFYSSWFYSGVRLSTFMPKYQTPEAISQYLNLPIGLVRQVIAFLVQAGLCIEQGGKVKAGPLRTWIEADSPLVNRHHMNWRIKAMERMPKRSSSEFFMTFPVSISQADSVVVRSLLLDAFDEIDRIVKSTQGEKVTCLNIDWFDV